MIPISFLAAGAVTGLGVGLLVCELLPGPPELGAALERMSAPAAPAVVAPAGATRRQRAGGYLVAHAHEIPGLSIPRTDLDLVGRDPETFLFNKVAATVFGALAVPYLAVLAAIRNIHVPLAIPLLCSGLMAAMFWVAADADLASKAKRARSEASKSLASYLDLIALRRAAESGIVESLEAAALLGDGWLFLRLREALDRARLEKIPPWEGLRALAEQLDLPALRDVADITSWAGTDGAAVYAALRAKAEGMRTAQGNAEAELAATGTVKLTMVGAVLAVLLMIAIGYPAISRILSH